MIDRYKNHKEVLVMFISSITVGLLAATLSLGTATGISTMVDKFRQEKLLGKFFSQAMAEEEETPAESNTTKN